MVVHAEAAEIVEIRRAMVGGPGFDVVRDPKRHMSTSREATVPVAAQDLTALGGRGEPDLTPLVHGVAIVVVDADHDGGVTGQTLQGPRVDQAAPFELGHQLVAGCPAVEEIREAHVGHHQVRVRRAMPLPGSPAAQCLDQGIGQTLIERRLAVTQLGGPSLEPGAHLGEDLGLQLGHHGATGLVEAHRAPALVGMASGRGHLGLGRLGQLAHRAGADQLGPPGVAVGAGHGRNGAHLVERGLTGAQRARQGG